MGGLVIYALYCRWIYLEVGIGWLRDQHVSALQCTSKAVRIRDAKISLAQAQIDKEADRNLDGLRKASSQFWAIVQSSIHQEVQSGSVRPRPICGVGGEACGVLLWYR